ncbi:FAD-binding oxidoreductase [Nocardia vinacea]|uniref:FAD-binding oxidoreductase n=1 Tax=Nocardia vinacea TaxID=96468 RepID=UPI000A039CB8|nr:FAD-linked oxidase C-terminal domain-containing protein [Nocardia vinacea]
MLGYVTDHASFVKAQQPIGVAFPNSRSEVETLCRLATKHRIPIVPRGAGTGLSGGATAVADCLVLSLEKMNRILEIDSANATAVVQPGVVNGDLSRAVAEHNLYYPPDPGSQEISTIGGNIATNAGGLCCVKYGVTRDYVLGLEVVLADGRSTRLGRRSRKGVAGLDLTGLFVGSEGILGIVTEVTVRLVRQPGPARSTVVAEFPSLAAASDAVRSIMQGCIPSMLEIMDAQTLDALRRWKSLEFSPGSEAVLICQTDSPQAESCSRDAQLMEKAALDSGATTAFSTNDPHEGAEITAIRRMAGTAIEQLGTTLVEDVAVPITQLSSFLSGVRTIAGELAATIAVFGHAGDGNMHPCIVFDASDRESVAIAERAFSEIARLGLRLGGTITGEHGVGALKVDLLEAELSEVALDMQRAVKHALDPVNLMNPGKVVSRPRRPR